MNWDEFTSIPNGTRILNHGYDQCVALANLYHEGVVGGSFVPVNSAYQWWTDFNRFPQLTSKYRRSSDPVPGAIFVSRGGIYDLPNGHIGVVTALNKGGHFDTMEQNAGARYLGRYVRGMQNILGFLIPINNPAEMKPAPPAPEPEPIIEEDEDFMTTIYIRPTTNSSPIKPGDSTTSRIWAGDNRVYRGVPYSGTWAMNTESGVARRMTMAEWEVTQGAYIAADRELPLSQPHGNTVEVIVYGERIPGF